MSNGKDKFGNVEFECDRCGEVTGGDTKDFDEAWETAKGEGWKYRGNGRHICPSCAENE